MGLEGIVSKRKDAPYRSGRQEIWTKTNLVMDGEVTVFGRTGLPDFQALRREFGQRHIAAVDLPGIRPALSGRTLRRVPLIGRKRMLGGLLRAGAGAIAYVDYLELDEGSSKNLGRIRADSLPSISVAGKAIALSIAAKPRRARRLRRHGG
jgi:ATP-dependent DNA ligase